MNFWDLIKSKLPKLKDEFKYSIRYIEDGDLNVMIKNKKDDEELKIFVKTEDIFGNKYYILKNNNSIYFNTGVVIKSVYDAMLEMKFTYLEEEVKIFKEIKKKGKK